MDTKSTPQNIQDAFLNTMRRERDAVTIYLMNGAKLSGRIKSFDKFSVLLESGSQEQLIFKHAISTIMHARRASPDMPRSGQMQNPPPPIDSRTDQVNTAPQTSADEAPR